MFLLSLLISLTSAQWTLMDSDAPAYISQSPLAQPPLYTLPAVWCSETEQGVIYTLNNLNQVWRFEVESKRWIWQPDATTITQSPVASWTIQNKFYLLVTNASQFYYYDLDTRDFNPLPSYPRMIQPYPAFWTHQASNRLYLLNGADLSAYDVHSNTWTDIPMQLANAGPTSFVNVSAVLSGQMVYVYIEDKLWEMDLTGFKWTQSPIKTSTPPGPLRINYNIWKSAKSNDLILFGGISGSKLYGDTWSYSLDNKEWKMISENGGPSMRWGSGQCLDISTGYMYLFGANGHNDMWQYGPFTAKNAFEMIEWKLDSATLAASIAAIMSTLVAVGLLILAIGYCVYRCKKRRIARSIPLAGGGNSGFEQM
jgi:hypothetical protein